MALTSAGLISIPANSVDNADISPTANIESNKLSYDPPVTGVVAQTVEEKLSTSISITDFGAVGDGITNDSPSIQKAVDFVLSVGGGEVLFPPGNYLIESTITIDKPESGTGTTELAITLSGVNFGSSALVRSSTLVGPTVYVGGQVTTGTNDVRSLFSIKNLSFITQGPPSANYTDSHLALCGVIYVDIYGLTFFDGGCNLWLRGVTQANISNCTSVWSNTSVSGVNRHMVIVDKTPSTYGYQQLCGDLTFNACNFRMGSPNPNPGPPAKSTMWVRCCDGVFITGCHLQGGSYVIWIDNTEAGITPIPLRGLFGIRVDNSWLDLVEGSGGSGDSTVYIEGSQKEAGNWSFSDTVFNGGSDYDYAISCPLDNVNCLYGLQVDNCHFVGYKREAINLNVLSSSVFSFFQITNNVFYLIQTSSAAVNKPIIALTNVDLVLVENNSTPGNPSANQFLVINSGTSQVQVTGNLINLPSVIGGNYSNAIVAGAGVSLYQFNNPPVLAPGPFADDSAAAAGGVPVGGFYRNGSTISQRVV